MAGTGWKAGGTILIVLGAIGLLVGVGGAAFGGAVLADAASDAENCGGLLQPRCDRSSIEERGEAGGMAMAAGGGLALLGLALVVIGIVFVFVGSSAARKEQMRALSGRTN